MQKRVDVGSVLNRAFSIYGAQAGTLLPTAFVLFLLVGVVNGLLAGSLVLLPLTFAIGVIAGTLYQGMVVALVSDVQDGRRDYSVGELLRSVTPVLLPLIVAGFLAGLGIGIGLILLLVPGLFLATIWAVVGPAIVVERVGALEAFRRSRELVKGDAWAVFGVIVITFIITFVVSAIFGGIAAAADDTAVVRIVANVLASTLTAPLSALVGAVLFFSLRGGHGVAPGVGTGGDADTTAPADEAVPATTPPPPPPPPSSSGPQDPVR